MRKYTVLLCLLSIGKLSAQTIVTDRPDQTESSSTVSLGSLQIESGLLVGYSQSERQLSAPSTLFRYGITKGVEIRVLSQLESIKNQLTDQTITGISDVEIGAKIQLFQKDDVNTEVAFLSHLVLPTGSKALTNDNLISINKLSISHEINENLGIGYNLGYNYFGVEKAT